MREEWEGGGGASLRRQHTSHGHARRGRSEAAGEENAAHFMGTRKSLVDALSWPSCVVSCVAGLGFEVCGGARRSQRVTSAQAERLRAKDEPPTRILVSLSCRTAERQQSLTSEASKEKRGTHTNTGEGDQQNDGDDSERCRDHHEEAQRPRNSHSRPGAESAGQPARQPKTCSKGGESGGNERKVSLLLALPAVKGSGKTSGGGAGWRTRVRRMNNASEREGRAIKLRASSSNTAAIAAREQALQGTNRAKHRATDQPCSVA